MHTRALNKPKRLCKLAMLLAIWPLAGLAQTPVDESGNPIDDYQVQGTVVDDSNVPVATAAELEALVGPIALYPDDLLAIILPASTYPLQLVEAARFLEALEDDPSLRPDDDWDDSVVALTNYPEVIELLNEDLDWTWRLGEAVVAQQADVIAAIEVFRDRAYAAGNLNSDEYQNVTHEDGVIEISPVNEEIIYVPYYEPERVVVYQPRPVYYYYPRPYPVYYYPYPYGYSFNDGYFWGVTTAFSIGWATDYLHVRHHSYYGHPYYGHSYNNRWWYRRPSISVHNNYYYYNSHYSNDRYGSGDRWRPNNHRRMGPSGRQVTRTRYLPNDGTQIARNATSNTRENNRRANDGPANTVNRDMQLQQSRDNVQNGQRQISDRRRATTTAQRNVSREQPADRTNRPNSRNDIQFRERDEVVTTRRDRQEHNSDTRERSNGGLAINPRPSSGGSSSNTHVARRASERGDVDQATREDRNRSQRTIARAASSQQTVAVARNNSNTSRPARSQSPATVARSSVATSRPATLSRRNSDSSRAPVSRPQSSPRVQAAAPPQAQRGPAPKAQNSQSGKSKSESNRNSKSNSENRDNRTRKR